MTDTAKAAGRPGLWTPMRTRSFLNLWCAQSVSLLGDGFSSIALSWITVTISRSSLALGVVLAFQAIPRALLTLLGGALSDRVSPRSLMMGSSCLRAALMIAVAGVGFGHLLSLWMLLIAAALFGAVDAFFQPARGSILPSAVPSEQLEPANALLNAGMRVAMIVGPALGGVVIAAADVNVAFLVDGCCFMLVAGFISGVRVRSRQSTVGLSEEPKAQAAASAASDEPPNEDSLPTQIRAGLSYVWADRRIRALVIVDAVVTFCYAGPFTVGFTSLVKFRLDGDARDRQSRL